MHAGPTGARWPYARAPALVSEASSGEKRKARIAHMCICVG